MPLTFLVAINRVEATTEDLFDTYNLQHSALKVNMGDEFFDASEFGFVERWAVVAVAYRGYLTVRKKSMYNGKPVRYHKATFQMYCCGPNGEKMAKPHSISFNAIKQSTETIRFLSAIGVRSIPALLVRPAIFFAKLNDYLAQKRPHVTFEYLSKDQDGKPKKHWEMINVQRCAGENTVPAVWHGFTPETAAWIAEHSEGQVKNVEDGKATTSERRSTIKEDRGEDDAGDVQVDHSCGPEEEDDKLGYPTEDSY